MKSFKNTRILFFTCLIGIAFSGCKKEFLEITPKGQVIAEKTEDYALMLNNLGDLGNQNYPYHQVMGDELAAFEPYFIGLNQKLQRAFRWEDNIFEADEDASEITNPLRALYYYNIIINEVMGSTDGTEQQKKALQAEAFAGRAWTYLQLINFFAKPYDPSNAATDPGFPIITESKVTSTDFKRATVQQVYDLIISDLKTAIPNLSAIPIHRYRMSRPAAAAILGKAYLFMGKFNEALEPLNVSMSDIAASTYPIRLYDYNDVLSPNGAFAPDPTFGPSLPNLYKNQENLYSRQTFAATSFTNAILLSPETAMLYNPSDMRLKFMSTVPFPSGNSFPLGMMQRLAPFSPIIGMTVPDVYLMRAEVKARLNDLAGAEADVEALREKRMPTADMQVPASILSDKNALVKFILDERIREFAGLGYRWFDMRRLSVDPDFKSTINTTHTLYSTTGAVEDTYTLRQERLTFKIPPKVLAQNPKMTDNP